MSEWKLFDDELPPVGQIFIYEDHGRDLWLGIRVKARGRNMWASAGGTILFSGSLWQATKTHPMNCPNLYKWRLMPRPEYEKQEEPHADVPTV